MEEELLSLKEEWNLLSNVPLFFKNMYKYFNCGGLSLIVHDTIFRIFSFYVICACTQILCMIDWHSLYNCEIDCKILHKSSFTLFLLIMSSFAYTYKMLFDLMKFVDIKNVYEHSLHITDPRLYTWEEITRKFILVNKTKKYTIESLDSLIMYGMQ